MPTRRFIFENDFDERPILIEPTLPIEITFSEDELNAAKEVAYLEGVNEGKRLQEQEINTKILDIVSSFEEKVNQFIEEEARNRQQLQVLAAKLAHTISVKICLTELEKNAVNRVSTCLERATSLLLNRPQVRISVHPELIEPLGERLQPLIEKEELNVVADPSLEIYDCRLDWQDGGAEILLRHTLDQIDDYINQLTK